MTSIRKLFWKNLPPLIMYDGSQYCNISSEHVLGYVSVVCIQCDQINYLDIYVLSL